MHPILAAILSVLRPARGDLPGIAAAGKACGAGGEATPAPEPGEGVRPALPGASGAPAAPPCARGVLVSIELVWSRPVPTELVLAAQDVLLSRVRDIAGIPVVINDPRLDACDRITSTVTVRPLALLVSKQEPRHG